MSVLNLRRQAMACACGKGSITDTMGKIDPTLQPLYEGSAERLLQLQGNAPLEPYTQVNPQGVAGLSPPEYRGMGGAATLSDPSYLSALALGNIMNAEEYAGAGPTTGQPNQSNDMSLQSLMEFFRPRQADVSAYSGGGGNGGGGGGGRGAPFEPGQYNDPFTPGPGPSYGPPGEDDRGGNSGNPNQDPGKPYGPGNDFDSFGMTPQPTPGGGGGKTPFGMMPGDSGPIPGSGQLSGGTDPWADMRARWNADPSSLMDKYGISASYDPSGGGGTTFSKGGKSYSSVGAGHEGAGFGPQVDFLRDTGLTGAELYAADKALGSMGQKNRYEQTRKFMAGQETPAQVAARHKSAAGFDVSSERKKKTTEPPPASEPPPPPKDKTGRQPRKVTR